MFTSLKKTLYIKKKYKSNNKKNNNIVKTHTTSNYSSWRIFSLLQNISYISYSVISMSVLSCLYLYKTDSHKKTIINSLWYEVRRILLSFLPCIIIGEFLFCNATFWTIISFLSYVINLCIKVFIILQIKQYYFEFFGSCNTVVYNQQITTQLINKITVSGYIFSFIESINSNLEWFTKEQHTWLTKTQNVVPSHQISVDDFNRQRKVLQVIDITKLFLFMKIKIFHLLNVVLFFDFLYLGILLKTTFFDNVFYRLFANYKIIHTNRKIIKSYIALPKFISVQNRNFFGYLLCVTSTNLFLHSIFQNKDNQMSKSLSDVLFLGRYDIHEFSLFANNNTAINKFIEQLFATMFKAMITLTIMQFITPFVTKNRTAQEIVVLQTICVLMTFACFVTSFLQLNKILMFLNCFLFYFFYILVGSLFTGTFIKLRKNTFKTSNDFELSYKIIYPTYIMIINRLGSLLHVQYNQLFVSGNKIHNIFSEGTFILSKIGINTIVFSIIMH